jgi:hypothetical protein
MPGFRGVAASKKEFDGGDDKSYMDPGRFFSHGKHRKIYG